MPAIRQAYIKWTRSLRSNKMFMRLLHGELSAKILTTLTDECQRREGERERALLVPTHVFRTTQKRSVMQAASNIFFFNFKPIKLLFCCCCSILHSWPKLSNVILETKTIYIQQTSENVKKEKHVHRSYN